MALESAWKQIRCLKVHENPWKVLEFKSCKFWNFVCESTVQYTSVSHCSLNFECPRLGYGFLSIILVLEKMQFGSLKVLEKCLNFVLWVCYEPWTSVSNRAVKWVCVLYLIKCCCWLEKYFVFNWEMADVRYEDCHWLPNCYIVQWSELL